MQIFRGHSTSYAATTLFAAMRDDPRSKISTRNRRKGTERQAASIGKIERITAVATDGRKQMKRGERLSFQSRDHRRSLDRFLHAIHRPREAPCTRSKPTRLSASYLSWENWLQFGRWIFFLLSDKKNYFEELSKKLENKIKKGKANYGDLVRMERKNWWLLQLVFMCSESSSCDLWSPPTMFQGFCGEFAVRVERNAVSDRGSAEKRFVDLRE